ncbi:hypothetical protein AVEN_27983-1 [Araneus ventricosus]|uniref:Uncharacterized protein n=1 Tax=Araneus ventricosus TaxID=182803 RepID=A0A4Y2BF25_ARAVE|nr:hypothetical protein AVEN_27983-1 [Araneus ventricosus]
MAHFSTILYILIDNIESARIKTHYSYICGNDGVVANELDVTGLRSTNLAKSKFVLAVNEQFAICESQIKARRPDSNVVIESRKEMLGFSGRVNIKEKLDE